MNTVPYRKEHDAILMLFLSPKDAEEIKSSGQVPEMYDKAVGLISLYENPRKAEALSKSMLQRLSVTPGLNVSYISRLTGIYGAYIKRYMEKPEGKYYPNLPVIVGAGVNRALMDVKLFVHQMKGALESKKPTKYLWEQTIQFIESKAVRVTKCHATCPEVSFTLSTYYRHLSESRAAISQRREVVMPGTDTIERLVELLDVYTKRFNDQ